MKKILKKEVMQMNGTLIIQRGAPFVNGTSVPLEQSTVIVGRKGDGWLPDLAFQSAYISRKHFKITTNENNYQLIDLNSKHGTQINGQKLIPAHSYTLQHQDQISIANDTAVLTFISQDMDATLDLGPLLNEIHTSKQYELDPVLQKIRVKDEVYVLSEKEYACLSYLLQQHDTFVSKEMLKKQVWPERVMEKNDVFVNPEELNSLMYRVRKKIGQTLDIQVVRGKGYMLHFK